MRKRYSKWLILELLTGVIILLYVGKLLMAQAGGHVPFPVVEKEMTKVLKKDQALEKEDSSTFKRHYHMNPKEFQGTLLYSAQGVMGVEEVLIVKANSVEQLQQMKEAALSYVEQQKKNFEGYGTNQIKLLNDSICFVQGEYLFLSISPKNKQYKKIFEGCL